MVETAPDAQLSLVSVSTATDIEAAIDYLTRQDVDIIVQSQGVYGIEDDGDHRFTDDINAATGSGTLYVNSAGNAAQTHWEGEFRDADGDDFHEWTTSGDELNALPDSNSDFSGGKVTVFVQWEDDGDFSNYKPYLYNPVTEEYIAEGETFAETTNKYARLSAEVNPQPLSLVIVHTEGPANDEVEVIFKSGPQDIERNIPVSSITAPADVPATVSVAAYEVGSRQLAPYSSRGPTDDGQTGIDVTGYTNIQVGNGLYGSEEFVFTGTSAAAPYIGGVAALVEDDQPGDQSPTELTSTLKSSSDDILDPGTDTASGSGVVNAAGAVDVPETPPSVEVDVDPTDLSGDGTESNPYEISNASELQAMEDDLTANYQLVSNINASNTAQWNDQRGFDPVGEDPFNEGSSVAFSGSLDGNGFTITGLTIDRSTRAVGFSTGAVGLFGATDEEALLRDISLTGMTITGEENVGGVVGVNFGTIRAATASGDVTGSGEFNTGGLVGFAGNESLIQNATASVSVTGTNATGGVAGQNRGTIQTATAFGDVSGSGRFNVGGLVGFADNQSDIQNVTASGDVDGPDLVGGLVGQSRGTITDATASGDVNGVTFAGGLVGEVNSNGVITNATASGDVSGGNSTGGLVGFVDETSTVQQTTASGSVNGLSAVGGLTGQNRGTIQTAKASGDVTGTGIFNVGGLVGFADINSTTQNVTASGSVNGPDLVGGLIGQHRGTIQTATASGDVVGVNATGGLVGFSDGVIANARASGSVSGDHQVGGLVGSHIFTDENDVLVGTIRNSVAVGPVSGNSDVGGLVGNNTAPGTTTTGTVEQSYFDEQATGQTTSAGGIGLTTAEMQGTAAAQNLALAFGETWQTVPGGYPELIALADSDEDESSQSDPPGSETPLTVSRSVSSSEIAPGETVTLTTEIAGVSGAVSTSTNYEPRLSSATVQSVTVNGVSANPIIAQATANGSTVTLGDVETDATVTITEELTSEAETNVTHSITGEVTAGETTVEFDPVSVTVADIEPQSVVDEYDTDNDGDISITELGAAGADFASGELTITELGRLGTEFAS
jgi:hypothetical protein